MAHGITPFVVSMLEKHSPGRLSIEGLLLELGASEGNSFYYRDLMTTLIASVFYDALKQQQQHSFTLCVQ